MERMRVGTRAIAGWVRSIVVLLLCLSPQLAVTAQAACIIDSPDCGCFDDNGAWDPYGTLLEVAEQTLGTRESCVACFGLGVGTDAQGWVDHAIEFWEDHF